MHRKLIRARSTSPYTPCWLAVLRCSNGNDQKGNLQVSRMIADNAVMVSGYQGVINSINTICDRLWYGSLDVSVELY